MTTKSLKKYIPVVSTYYDFLLFEAFSSMLTDNECTVTYLTINYAK